MSEGREHPKVDEKESEGVRRREERKEQKEKIQKEDSSADQPRIPLTAAVIQAGRELQLTRGKKRNCGFIFFFLGKEIRGLPGEEREEEELGIRELLQPPCVLQGKMDSDSGEQSDGDLSPGKFQLTPVPFSPQHQCLAYWNSVFQFSIRSVAS